MYSGSKVSDFRSRVGAPEVAPRAKRYESFVERFRFALPEDYLAWAREYSSIEICGELLVNNLITDRTDLITTEEASDVMSWAPRTQINGTRSRVYNGRGEKIGPLPALPAFPQKGGLFPWGNDNNGTLYMWDTRESDPNQWGVVAYDGQWFDFETGFLDFLLNLLSGEYVNSGLFLKGWPWIPSIQEYDGTDDAPEDWHVPFRWRDYFMEYEIRSSEPDFTFDEMNWVEQFK